MLLNPYSTSKGTSLLRDSLTVSLSPLALQKLTRYLSEKVRATGSDRLISTLFSGFSTLVCERKVTEPLPMSPAHLKLTPSLVHSIVTARTVSAWYSGNCFLSPSNPHSKHSLNVQLSITDHGFVFTHQTPTERSNPCISAGTRDWAW